jgi:kinesin family protein 5
MEQVFGSDSTQTEVYHEVSGVVTSVMDGFNGTVMAYGQTSAGKSFTMEGLSLWDANSMGVIPRCVDALFEEINKADSAIQFQVVLSFYEIYCEKIRDLLNPSQVNLKIRESKTSGFMVQDITEVYCTDRESVLRVIEVGKANRVTAPTLMNAESSRSHSIVSILIDQKDLTTGRNKRGVLFLVDLAGSEKVSKTGASGMRLEEAKNINSSLTTLGMVINALCDGSSHVPYRDSKLTMILTDALGGNSKTTLIICCNPDARHIPETISTLRFGERAKRIKNNAHVNEEFSVEELKTMLAAARKEIESLKKRLRLSDKFGDIPLPPEFVPPLLDSNDDEGSVFSKNSRSVAQESELLMFNASRDEEQKLEIQSLKAKIIALEEELEMDRMR